MTKDRKSSAAAREGLVDMVRGRDSDIKNRDEADGLNCSRVGRRDGAMGMGLGREVCNKAAAEVGWERDAAAGFTEEAQRALKVAVDMIGSGRVRELQNSDKPNKTWTT